EALGRGGMGAVYLATDQTFGSTVAIKQTLCEGADLEKAFQREARLLNGLRHPALPVVIDYFIEARGQFLVMQYIPGDDFGALMDQRQAPFAPDEVVQWGVQLLNALHYLHEHDPQIIHRDIKPRNLKLTPRGEVVLLDFGLSKSTPVESHVAGTSVSVLGYTPHYAPFEQIQGQGTDPRSDLFALAATLYHLLTATLPPDAMVRALTTMNGQPDPLQPAHVVNPAVPEALGAVVHQAMAMGRDQRPQSAAALRAALQAAGAGLPMSAPAVSATAEAATIIAPARVDVASLVASEALASAVKARGGARAWPRPWLATVSVFGMVMAIGLVIAAPGRQRPTPSVALAPDAVIDDAAAPNAIAPAERTYAFQAATIDANGTIARAELQARSYGEDLGTGVAIEMVAIPAGEFQMGNASATYPDETPQRAVAIQPFYLSRYEVTQAQWRAVAAGLPRVTRALDPDPSGFKGDDLPVEQVSWDDAMEFCERLSRKTRHVYHLPSEAEWEYAARSGTTTAFGFGPTLAPTLASFDATVPFGTAPRGSAPTQTSSVGTFAVANGFGLYDMHGNVAEWCLGEYHPSYAGAPADGRPWITKGDTDRHVVRGGSWDDLAVDCRSANRYSYPRDGRQRTIGLRLAMSLQPMAASAQTANAAAGTPVQAAVAAPPLNAESVAAPLAADTVADPSAARRPPRSTDRPSGRARAASQ
ncbi:MAG: bifunctional serine/threonine-protein kinase/formylglycine-generating enzyme family protein, partial [Candidatus Binatia bacterium]